jgi:hypothetical protein
MLSGQEVSEANRLVKDLTSLDLKPVGGGMYALTSHCSFFSFFFYLFNVNFNVTINCKYIRHVKFQPILKEVILDYYSGLYILDAPDEMC